MAWNTLAPPNEIYFTLFIFFKASLIENSKICTNTTVVGCRWVQSVIHEYTHRYIRNVEVVRVKNVTEDCSLQAEYCQHNFRSQEVTQETVICQKPAEVVSFLVTSSLACIVTVVSRGELRCKESLQKKKFDICQKKNLRVFWDP